jgi:hypothetical protein
VVVDVDVVKVDVVMVVAGVYTICVIMVAVRGGVGQVVCVVTAVEVLTIPRLTMDVIADAALL